jgi:hypothetical protein
MSRAPTSATNHDRRFDSDTYGTEAPTRAYPAGIEPAGHFDAVAESYNLLNLIDKVLKREWSAIRRST